MLILQIIIWRIKQYSILFLKYYLLFNKYFRLLNFLFMLWLAPMDLKIIYEIFNALVNESEVENYSKEEGDNNNKETEPWLDNEKKLAIVTLVILVTVCVWYLYIMSGGSPGLDLSKFNRVLPETPINVDVDVKPSLLDENYNIKIVAWEARQEAAAAAQAAAQAALDASNSVEEAGSIKSKHW